MKTLTEVREYLNEIPNMVGMIGLKEDMLKKSKRNSILICQI